MIPIKSYMADSIVGKKLHFRCDCVLNIDIVGIVKGWSMYHGEIVWDVYTDGGKFIRIGENHPNMNIEEVK